jgi:DNA-binding CsgD family transcriptional regulator
MPSDQRLPVNGLKNRKLWRDRFQIRRKTHPKHGCPSATVTGIVPNKPDMALSFGKRQCSLLTGNLNNDAAEMAPIMTRLTDREREVAALVSNGLPNKTVAHKLNVSEGTVKTHLHHIFQKLGVQDRSELATVLLSVRVSARL